jgi:hypothetical protein
MDQDNQILHTVQILHLYKGERHMVIPVPQLEQKSPLYFLPILNNLLISPIQASHIVQSGGFLYNKEN